MIAVSDTLRALMVSGQYQRADLYTLTLITGTTVYWTSWQVAIVSGGHTFTPAIRIGGDRKWKVQRGLEASTFTVTIGVDPDNELQINGVPFRQAARAGLLSGAQLEMDWAYLSGGTLVGILPRFFGTVGQVMPDRLGAQLKVNSPLKVLDTLVPAKIYGPRCPWTLGDANCGVNLPSFAVTAVVTVGADQNTVPCLLGNPAGYFNQGIVTITSGQNKGLKRQVRSHTIGHLELATPLPFAPVPGDTISATPGCDHTVPQLSTTIVVPQGTAASQVIGGYSGRQPIYTNYPAIPPTVTIKNDTGAHATISLTYANGAKTGQALVPVTGAAAPKAGQYAASGNVYTFNDADTGAVLLLQYSTGATNPTATCVTVFNNVARNGATPFIPPPETAY